MFQSAPTARRYIDPILQSMYYLSSRELRYYSVYSAS